MKQRKTTLAIIAVICGIYVIGPDPFPVAIDDIIVGLIGAANFLKMFRGPDNTPKLHD